MAPTRNSPPLRHRRSESTFVLLTSVVAFAAGGFMLFLTYGFATMVHPDLPPAERSAQIAQRFLGSFPQTVLIFVSAIHMFGGAIFAFIHGSIVLTGRPTATPNRISLIASVVLATIFVGYFLWLQVSPQGL